MVLHRKFKILMNVTVFIGIINVLRYLSQRGGLNEKVTNIISYFCSERVVCKITCLLVAAQKQKTSVIATIKKGEGMHSFAFRLFLSPNELTSFLEQLYFNYNFLKINTLLYQKLFFGVYPFILFLDEIFEYFMCLLIFFFRDFL